MKWERTHAEFENTRWTLIEALNGDNAEDCRRAKERLLHRYWPPVYAHLRSKGLKREHASELTQAFFAEVVLGRHLFDRARRERGRLRNLLMTALDRYQIDQRRRQNARPDGWSLSTEMLDREDSRLERQSVDGAAAFDRRWALASFEEALRRSENHFKTSGREDHWHVFDFHVLRPALAMSPSSGLKQAIIGTGFASTGAAAAALQVVKERIEAVWREVISETLLDPADLDHEMAALKNCLELAPLP